MPDPPTYDFCSNIKDIEHKQDPEPKPETLDDIKEATGLLKGVTDSAGEPGEVDDVSSTVITLGAFAVIAGLF